MVKQRSSTIADRKSGGNTKNIQNGGSFCWTVGAVIILATAFILPASKGAKVIVNIDGNWSPWSTLASPCNASCGGGSEVRVRSCTNPKPQGMEAKICEGENKKYFECNTEACSMQWSGWSGCSAYCGRGMKLRHTLCARERNGDLFDCEGDQYFTHTDECNTWNKTGCPNPCEGYECMDFGKCEDISSDEDPATECVCQLGKIFNEDRTECVDPPPPTPSERPIPTMKPMEKAVSATIVRTASTVLIIFVTITIIIFLYFRIWDPARVIQMNMEIALVCAHICLLYPSDSQMIWLCRLISILIQMFFTTAFVFMFLESLHTYSLVAFVVKRDGLLTNWQNVLTGWGLGIGISLIGVTFQYKNYGGEYHCWLQMDKYSLLLAQYAPITAFVILTLTMIEAAGAANYRMLPGIDTRQQTSAKIMQRSNLVIMPLCYISFMVGTLAEYEQNFGLYGTFTIINGILGCSVFFFHCTGNEQVRGKLEKAYKTIIKKEKY